MVAAIHLDDSCCLSWLPHDVSQCLPSTASGHNCEDTSRAWSRHGLSAVVGGFGRHESAAREAQSSAWNQSSDRQIADRQNVFHTGFTVSWFMNPQLGGRRPALHSRVCTDGSRRHVAQGPRDDREVAGFECGIGGPGAAPQGKRARPARAPRTRTRTSRCFSCLPARCFTPLLFLVGYFCHLQCFEIACKTDAEPRRSLQRYPCNYKKDRTLCP